MLFNECGKSMIKGHLRIYEEESQKVLLDRHNDIHPENFSLALANSLSNNNNGFITEMVFGSNGVKVNASNEYFYSNPQTLGRTASLHNQTYSKSLIDKADDTSYITVSHVNGNIFTDILVHCTLGKNEPVGQNVDRNDGEISSEYVFSEVGLQTYGGDLLTHICHYPIKKDINTTLVFDYLVRIQIV